MLGADINLADIMKLLQAVRAKDLKIEVKVLDEPWQSISAKAIGDMLRAISHDHVQRADDIRLRLHGNEDAIE